MIKLRDLLTEVVADVVTEKTYRSGVLTMPPEFEKPLKKFKIPEDSWGHVFGVYASDMAIGERQSDVNDAKQKFIMWLGKKAEHFRPRGSGDGNMITKLFKRRA